MSYELHDYVAMVADSHRTGAYARALQRMVRADSVVLDLGTGFGFFAVLAARLGARHVYAIDPNDAIALGPELARENGVSDRVTFLRGDSRDIVLPEVANLLVEDVRGVLPFHADRVRILLDARARLLTADARMVAVRDRLFAAPLRARREWAEDQAVLRGGAFGVNLGVVARRSADGWRRARIKPDQLLFDAAPLGCVELATVESPNFEGIASWTVPVATRVDGFTVWFEAELAEGERFSTAPGREQAAHGGTYFALREPLDVSPGDDLRFHFVGTQSGSDYAWSWDAAWRRGADAAWAQGPRQSTIASALLSARGVDALSREHQPRLGQTGLRLQRAAALMNGRRESQDIADALAAAPDCGFRDAAAAFQWLLRALRDLEDGAIAK